MRHFRYDLAYGTKGNTRMEKITDEEYGRLKAHRRAHGYRLRVEFDAEYTCWLVLGPPNAWAQDLIALWRRQAAVQEAEKLRAEQELGQRCKCSAKLVMVTPLQGGITLLPDNVPTLCPMYLHDLRKAVQSHRERLDQIDAKHGVTT